MKNMISDYITAKDALLQQFALREDYPVRICLDSKWRLSGEGGIYFLTFWQDSQKMNCVCAKNDGYPMVYESGEYSMVVAIDCIKFAFLFKNINKG